MLNTRNVMLISQMVRIYGGLSLDFGVAKPPKFGTNIALADHLEHTLIPELR
jgi:hypothetical protein